MGIAPIDLASTPRSSQPGWRAPVAAQLDTSHSSEVGDTLEEAGSKAASRSVIDGFATLIADLEKRFENLSQQLAKKLQRLTAGFASPPPRALESTAARQAQSTVSPYDGLIRAAAQRHALDPALLTAVARRESAFDPTAVSKAGAQGLMQLMPGTAKSLGVSDAFDPAQNIEGGAKLLRGLIDQFGGRLDLALAAYNAGPGAVQRYGGVPPYQETQSYVRDILADYRAKALVG